MSIPEAAQLIIQSSAISDQYRTFILEMGESYNIYELAKNINFETLSKLQKIDLVTLPEVSSSTRIGPCISQPGKFIGIGLNYSDHAAETGAKPPSEPIVFMKATSCIIGPNDDVIIHKNSKKTDSVSARFLF